MVQASLSGAVLFPQRAEKNWRQYRTGCGVPFEFSQKVGYEIVGMILDANGPGKSDILMARSLLRAGG